MLQNSSYLLNIVQKQPIIHSDVSPLFSVLVFIFLVGFVFGSVINFFLGRFLPVFP